MHSSISDSLKYAEYFSKPDTFTNSKLDVILLSTRLCSEYNVTTLQQLVIKQAEHIERLINELNKQTPDIDFLTTYRK